MKTSDVISEFRKLSDSFSVFTVSYDDTEMIRIHLDKKSLRFHVLYTTVSTPKLIIEKTKQFTDKACSKNRCMIVAPYVSKETAKLLWQEKISWMDLNGNHMVSDHDNIFISHSGNKNKYTKTKRRLKNAYAGVSSITGKAFLLQETFKNQTALVEFINERSSLKIGQPQISLALGCMDDDLIISKSDSGEYQLDNRDKLLEALIKNYKHYSEATFMFVSETKKVYELLNSLNIKYIITGDAAGSARGVISSDITEIVVNDLSSTIGLLKKNLPDLDENKSFGNIKLIHNTARSLWFNQQVIEGNNYIDDIELYLQLINSGARGHKAAEMLQERSDII